VDFRFPLRFSGVAEVCEWYDDERRCFGIEVRVSNPTWGPLFGYHGSFTANWLSVRPGTAPADAYPRRTERRS